MLYQSSPQVKQLSFGHFVRCSSHTLCRYKTDQSKCAYPGLVTQCFLRSRFNMEADFLLCDYYIGYSVYTNSLSVQKQSISQKTTSQAQVCYLQASYINLTSIRLILLTVNTVIIIVSICLGAVEEVVGSLDGQLEEIFGMLKKKLNEDASFTPPIRAFVSSFFQIKTDSALQASLFSFGKTTPIINQINVLPATVPRRRGALAGRRAVGRPPKNSRREHPYCNSRSNNTPQTLTFCLQDNNMLEKTD